MTDAPAGLVEISTERLHHLLGSVYRGDVECPLTPLGLARVRLQPQALAILGHLRGLDQRAVQAVLVAVIAEHHGQEGRERANPAPA